MTELMGLLVLGTMGSIGLGGFSRRQRQNWSGKWWQDSGAPGVPINTGKTAKDLSDSCDMHVDIQIDNCTAGLIELGLQETISFNSKEVELVNNAPINCSLIVSVAR